VLARQAYGQGWTLPEVQRRGGSVLPDEQELVQSAVASSYGGGAKSAQARRPGQQVPDFSTVSGRQKHLAATIEAQATTTGMHLLIDRTGVKMLGKASERQKPLGRLPSAAAQGLPRDRRRYTWDSAIEVTDTGTGDAPMLACLLEQISVDETIASVSANGTYDASGCHEAIAQRGAQAIIPTRENAKLWKDPRSGAEAQNAIFHATRRLGRRIWKKMDWLSQAYSR